MIKNIIMTLRTSIKLIFLIILGIFIIVCLFAAIYKPIYSVSINGEFIGYCGNKSDLQLKINEYMEMGDKSNSNIAFVQINNIPEYKMCLLKRGITTNDEEIYNTVINSGITYYKYYSILLKGEEKVYVGEFSTAEEIVNKLKEKNTNNIDDITISEIYDTEMKEFTEIDNAVSSLYEKKPVVVAQTTTKKTYSSKSMSYQSVPINISFIRPVSGSISSRFGAISSVRSGAHTGLDIATSMGTPIVAAASGTVTCASYQGNLGNLVKISHGNGIETYYGHCSKIYVKVGQQVSQGEKIAAVGSTGNSTGPHLHLEIRVNGVAYNPQNYLY